MFAFDSAAEMSPWVMTCLMFPVSTAHRAVQNTHTGHVNIAESGEMEPKVERQDHPNCMQFRDGLNLLENNRLWKILQNWQSGRRTTIQSDGPFLAMFLHQHLILPTPSPSYCCNSWVVVELLGACILLCHSERGCSCCCARLESFQDRICVGSVHTCQHAEKAL